VKGMRFAHSLAATGPNNPRWRVGQMDVAIVRFDVCVIGAFPMRSTDIFLTLHYRLNG